MSSQSGIKTAPKGLAVLLLVGPAFVWCAEYIGSGEVILATRMGAILGCSVLWAPVIGIILKACIGIGGARYTVATGEGMIDMFSRMPGRGNWAVWIVMIGQLFAGAIAIGGVASAAGVFASSLIPLKPFLWGWIITIFAIAAVWSGAFDIIKNIMSFLVLIVVIGVLYITVRTMPPLSDLFHGIFGFSIPPVPEWALAYKGMSDNPWREILPLLGWAAGGFASQVWYTYWVLGAGYGLAGGRDYGCPCDEDRLKKLSADDARKVKGWFKVVHTDAFVALLIGIVVTSGFLLAGSGVLRPEKIAPEGASVAFELARIFERFWGRAGAILFIIAGSAALVSTLIGQFAGWPRLLADSFRICIPAFAKRFSWRHQFRIFVIFFFFTNIVVVYSFGFKPVFVLKMGAVFEGLLFTPFQAILVLVGLTWVQKKLLSDEAWDILKPGILLIGSLVVAALVFGYFCLFQLV